MSEKIVNWIVGTFAGITASAFGKEILVFIISLMPILELRGGLIAASLLKMDPLPSYFITLIGNIIPIPFILWLFERILVAMRKSKHFKKIANWLDRKVEKNKDSINKFGWWGLILFVGIPLPGTGAWTGSMVAAILHMDKKKAFFACCLGVLVASIIMMLISFGILRNLI